MLPALWPKLGSTTGYYSTERGGKHQQRGLLDNLTPSINNKQTHEAQILHGPVDRMPSGEYVSQDTSQPQL